MKEFNNCNISNYLFSDTIKAKKWIHVLPIHVAIRELINGLRKLSYCAANNLIYPDYMLTYTVAWVDGQNKKHLDNKIRTSETIIYNEFIKMLINYKEELKQLPLASKSTFKKSMFKIFDGIRHLAYYKDNLSIKFMNEAADQYLKVDNSNATQRHKRKSTIDEINEYLFFIFKIIWSGKTNNLKYIPKPVPTKKLHD